MGSTNAILLDKHGVTQVLDSGLSHITISTAGFEENMYRRVYRSTSYQRNEAQRVGAVGV